MSDNDGINSVEITPEDEKNTPLIDLIQRAVANGVKEGIAAEREQRESAMSDGEKYAREYNKRVAGVNPTLENLRAMRD